MTMCCAWSVTCNDDLMMPMIGRMYIRALYDNDDDEAAKRTCVMRGWGAQQNDKYVVRQTQSKFSAHRRL